jgi:hypothetical protein
MFVWVGGGGGMEGKRTSGLSKTLLTFENYKRACKPFVDAAFRLSEYSQVSKMRSHRRQSALEKNTKIRYNYD